MARRRKCMTFFYVFILMWLTMSWNGHLSQAAAPEFAIQVFVGTFSKFVTVDQNTARIELTRPVDRILLRLIFKKTHPNLEYMWEQKGGGNFEGLPNKSAIAYLPPRAGDETASQPEVSITVRNQEEEETQKRILFTFLSPQPTAIPTPTRTPTPIPLVTPTKTPTPLPTATPAPTQTPRPIPTATLTPLPTAPPVPTQPPTPFMTSTPSMPPTPTQTPSKVEQLLEQAKAYTQSQAFTTPAGRNAFETCQAILQEDPGNQQAYKLLTGMVQQYELWGDRAYQEQDWETAREYYQRAQKVGESLAHAFEDQRIQQNIEAVQKKLEQIDMLAAGGSIPPTATPTQIPLAFAIPTATPTPVVVRSRDAPRATPTPEAEMAPLLENADEHFQDGLYGLAEEAYRQALERRPANAHARRQLIETARIYAHLGERFRQEQRTEQATLFDNQSQAIINYILPLTREQVTRIEARIEARDDELACDDIRQLQEIYACFNIIYQEFIPEYVQQTQQFRQMQETIIQKIQYYDEQWDYYLCQ